MGWDKEVCGFPLAVGVGEGLFFDRINRMKRMKRIK